MTLNFSQHVKAVCTRARRASSSAQDATRRSVAAVTASHQALALVVGPGLVAYGAAQVYDPAGWIAAGAAVTVFFGPFGGGGDGPVAA